MTFLLTSVGRRVGLIELLKKSYPECTVLAGDHLPTSSALNIADQKLELPYTIDDNYMETILKVCIEKKVDFVIPLIDTELRLFSRYRDLFKSSGIQIMISSVETVEISMDKMKTYHYFKNYTQFKTPYSIELSQYDPAFLTTDKVVLKPTNGSSGQGIYILNRENASSFSKLMDIDESKYMAQEFVDFDSEVTTDCFCYEDGSVAELCQRKRLKVRGGEVEQAMTIKDPKITEIVLAIANDLEFYGVVNIQIMIQKGNYYLGEINARFGGGFPLSCHAGANMLEHFEKINDGNNYHYGVERYKDHFCMLRYDTALYLQEDQLTWSK